MMLDDIKFENCLEGEVPAGSDQLSCGFENNTCSWYHDYTANLLWKRSKGGFMEGPVGNGEDPFDIEGEFCFNDHQVASKLQRGCQKPQILVYVYNLAVKVCVP